MALNGPRRFEQSLVQRCRQGEPAAWNYWCARYLPALVAYVRGRLGPAQAGGDLADEIADRVQCSLFDRGGQRLAMYNAERGSLTAYLRSLARDEIHRALDEAYRRRRRDLPAGEEAPPAAAGAPALLLEEFVGTLTPRVAEYVVEHQLGGQPGRPARPLSAANARKLKERALRRLLAFLGRREARNDVA